MMVKWKRLPRSSRKHKILSLPATGYFEDDNDAVSPSFSKGPDIC